MEDIEMYYYPYDINWSSQSLECPKIFETPLNHEEFPHFPGGCVEQSINLEAMDDLSSIFLEFDTKTWIHRDVEIHQGDLQRDLHENEKFSRSSASKDMGLRENLLKNASCDGSLEHNNNIQDERRLTKRKYQGSWESNGKQQKKRLKGESKKWDIAPQVLASRRRREKINQKLRILKTLIPNGKKVDMSTMLERAISYVKFLQFQIKLLSSDEYWMFAPPVYNRMETGMWPQVLDFNSSNRTPL